MCLLYLGSNFSYWDSNLAKWQHCTNKDTVSFYVQNYEWPINEVNKIMLIQDIGILPYNSDVYP